MSNIKIMNSNEKTDAATEVQAKNQEPTITVVPKADICETEDALLIWADMAGVEGKTVDITLEKNSLTIEGQVESYVPPEDCHQVMEEFPVGNYKRTFTIGVNVQRNGIEGKLKNGFLSLVIPKSKETAARKIQISAD